MHVMTTILDVRNLRKEFRDTIAVHDVSFQVKAGSCFGLLGPNGAGKTTTIEIIEDIIPATSGTILYKGQPRTASFRQEIGIQFQHTSLLSFLSIKETLVTFAKLFNKPINLESLIDRCDLRELVDRRNTELSGGQTQRLMLALALINDPELIFLDEPSTGLDPQSRRNLWQILKEINDQEKTIIMTTHSMEEAENLCDEIAIMDRGLIIAQGTVAELIQTHCPTATITLPHQPLDSINNRSEVSYQIRNDQIIIDTESLDSTLHLLTQSNVNLNTMTIHTPNLEDVFLKLTGRTLRD